MDYLTLSLVLFAVGLVLLVAEIFLPSGGILVVISLLAFAGGVGIILSQGTTLEAVIAIAALSLGLPTAFYFIVAAWRRMAIGMVPPDTATAPSTIPAVLELEALKNRVGKTVSPMRPSGIVDFGNKRVDALTEGEMLEAGVWVRCIDVKPGRVIVRKLEVPPETLEDIQPQGGASPATPPGPAPSASPGSSSAVDPLASPPPARRSGENLDLDLDLR
jgi:membrane-bound ClpP family serine protease